MDVHRTAYIIHRNYTFLHRTKYVYIEITNVYIEPNTHTLKLHINEWYRTIKSKCIRKHRNNPFILRIVSLCSSSWLEVLNRENFYINRNLGATGHAAVTQAETEDEDPSGR